MKKTFVAGALAFTMAAAFLSGCSWVYRDAFCESKWIK